MTITIYGAGAIGGCVGAYIARAGETVQFVDRMADHVAAINATGLKISGFDDFTVSARACMPAELRGPLEIVFLAVKSQDTADALGVTSPLVGPDTVVVSLQNGMNEHVIAARIGAEHVIAAFVSLAADWQVPGHIEHGAAGNIWVGELDGRITQRLMNIQRLLKHAVTAHTTENIFGYLWTKQIDSSLMFAQAVTDETYFDLYGNARYQTALIALVAEGVDLAHDAGVRLEVFDDFEAIKMWPRTAAEEPEARAALNRFADVFRTRLKVRSGPWRDLAVRKRPTEVDHMVGWLVAEGHRRGFAVPLNERLLQQVKEIEKGVRARGLHNIDELENLRRQVYGDRTGSS